MKNERNVTIQENGQATKHRYRLNKKKFAIALAVLCFVIAAVIIIVHYIGGIGWKEAIAALAPPQPASSGKSPGSSVIDPDNPFEGKVIAVDAGHGGDDPGTTGINGTVESKLNLSVAFQLKQQLEDKGAEVVMTRSDESLAATKDEDWAKRQATISKSGPDILVSIHMNSFSDSKMSGPLVLFLTGSEQGKKLAKYVQKGLNSELGPKNPGTSRSEDLKILKYGLQPSVLVECGYISNPQEEEMLNTQEYQLKVAKAICDGLIEYYIG